MPESLPRLRERVRELERDVARLTSRADRAPERLPVMSELRNPRLAITAYDPNDGTYPSSPADTYWIIFVDATYDKTDDGQQTVTKTDRQTSARVVARSLVDEYLERDTLVEVIWDNGRWWIARTSGLSLALYQITLESPGEKDTIAWDTDVGAFYVWGKPVTETAEPMVIDDSEDAVKLWITAQYSEPEGRVDGLSSFAVGSRVYTVTRNGRREIVAPQFHDPRWEIVKNQASSALNGYALRVTHSGMLVNDGVNSDRAILLDVHQGCATYTISGTDYWQINRLPMVNSPRSVANQFLGRATFACDRPAWAAVSGDLSSTLYGLGRPLGPAPGSWLLWPGLPGFVSLGKGLTDADGVDRALVMRDTHSQCWWAKANGDWVVKGMSPYVYAYACAGGHGSQKYDGTGAYPTIDMKVEFPKMGSQEDPNIHDGDYFLYSIQGTSDPGYSRGSPFIAYGDYLDGHVGEIRFLTGAKSGWALADGSANSVANGGTGRNLVANNPFLRFETVYGGTGGSSVHSHPILAAGYSVAGLGGGSGRLDLANADHTPPYYDLAPYERIH